VALTSPSGSHPISRPKEDPAVEFIEQILKLPAPSELDATGSERELVPDIDKVIADHHTGCFPPPA
jgi:hypothetical protein